MTRANPPDRTEPMPHDQHNGPGHPIEPVQPPDQDLAEPNPGVPWEPSSLALALIEALPRLCGADSPASSAPAPALAELIAAMAAALERGELDLALAGPPPAGIQPQGWPQRHRQALDASPLVVPADDLERLPEAPLVWTGEHLRWRRWHLQLEACLGQLTARAQAPLSQPLDATAVAEAVASAAAEGLDAQQQQAVAALLRHGLVLLGGGPGTGKTSTVAQMLGALLALRPQLRLHLAAPTGKAAARLRSTLQAGGQRLAEPLAERLGQAPCTTLHRLLESSGERFGRNRRRPLALDLLVVDELSMVDLPLMAALLEALPVSCQLLLVGDPAQLPPVGPGAVLQELTQPARLSALGEAAIQLTTTYRNNGAIAAFAALLRPGDQATLLRPGNSTAPVRSESEAAAPQARPAAGFLPGAGAPPAAPAAGLPPPTERAAGTSTPAPGPEARAAHDQARALRALLANLGPEDNLIWQSHPGGRLPAPVVERLRHHQQRLRALAEAIPWDTGSASSGAQAGSGGEGNSEGDVSSRAASREAASRGTASPPAPRSRPDPTAASTRSDPPSDPMAALLAELEACVLLSPVRQGAWGVEAVHRQLLGEAAGQPIQHWPLGTPVLCQRNLAEEGLANGDIGVLVERAGERLVLVPGAWPGQPGAGPDALGSRARLFHPARLGAAEPALALTIHKSQGSQYQEVLLLVPQTRHWDPRLLYTGLTRARQRAWLITTGAPSWLQSD